MKKSEPISSFPTFLPNEDQVVELLLRIARRADELARQRPWDDRLDCWRCAEQEVWEQRAA